jgi:hypothetical protein
MRWFFVKYPLLKSAYHFNIVFTTQQPLDLSDCFTGDLSEQLFLIKKTTYSLFTLLRFSNKNIYIYFDYKLHNKFFKENFLKLINKILKIIIKPQPCPF